MLCKELIASRGCILWFHSPQLVAFSIGTASCIKTESFQVFDQAEHLAAETPFQDILPQRGASQT